MRYFILSGLFFVSGYVFPQMFELVWETEQILKTPESVQFDKVRDQVYVSNINGKPTDKDANGFISLLGKDGTIKEMKWVTGLDAPKGMTIVGDYLYVTDIDRIHQISIPEQKIVKTIAVQGAQFLNDMAADENERIYISDMVNNHVLVIDGDTAVVWLSGEDIIRPNGLAYSKGKLFVGTNNQLLKVDPVTAEYKVHVDETGSIDGLIPLGGGKFVISDWSGRIQMISPDERIVLGNTTEENIQAADLGFIPGEQLILIPTFFDNRVMARRIP